MTPQRDARFAELDALIAMGYGDTPQNKIRFTAPTPKRVYGTACPKCGSPRVKGRCSNCRAAYLIRYNEKRAKTSRRRRVTVKAKQRPAILPSAFDGLAEAVGA